MKTKGAQLATNEPVAAQDLMIKSILMWSELVVHVVSVAAWK